MHGAAPIPESIRSELPVDYLERPPADTPTVRVRTVSGHIRIVAAGAASPSPQPRPDPRPRREPEPRR